jgi:hypothetical protein
MGLLARVIRPSGPTHGGPSYSFLSKSRWRGTYGTKPFQQPLSAWQASFDLEESSLPPLGEVAECYVLFEIIGRVLPSQL